MKDLNSNNKESFPLWRKFLISFGVLLMSFGLLGLYFGNSLKESSTTRSMANSSFLKVDDGKLSNEKAQRALDIFMDGAGKATIVGVQEETNSSAVADLNFQNLPYNEYGKSKQYSGAGKAYFIRYNDGKWMMNKLTFIPLDRAQYDHNALTLELKNKIEAK
jgi:hypothetical protein